MDCLEYGIQVFKHFVIPKSQNANAAATQELSSNCIMPARSIGVVLASVELDGELRRIAVKVEDVRCYGLLAAKLHSTKPAAAEDCPHQTFGIRMVLPLLPGKVYQDRIESEFCVGRNGRSGAKSCGI